MSPPIGDATGVETVDVHYVTNRAETPTPETFSGNRSSEPSFGKIVVGIPPVHELGLVETTTGTPDPAKHFHQRGIDRYDSARETLRRAGAAGDGEGILIFVHGYNNSFTESLFRLAQLHHDAELPGASVAFQWASIGDARGYVYDRDSVMLARRTLAETLEVAAAEKRGAIRLGAHSMGSLLVMETLVRLSLEGKTSVVTAIDELVLISPDIDISVFEQHLEDIALPHSRIRIVVNQEDRLLRLSSVLAGGADRAGATPDADAMRDLGITVLDVTGVDDGDGPGHFLPATSPELLRAIRAAPEF